MKILIYISLLFAYSVGHSFSIIANNSVAQNEISASEVKEVYLGNKGTWNDGAAINVSMIANQVVLGEFLGQFVDMPYRMFDLHWKQTVFSGKAVQPKKAANDAEIVQYVSSTPGAIGFVKSADEAKGVKILTVK